MKKRVIIVLGVLVVLIVILALIICFKPREIKNINLAENITMKIKDGSLTNTGVTVIITDLSGDENVDLINRKFKIDYKKNDKWYRLESKIKNEVTVMTTDNVMENGDNTYTQEINWVRYYGKLDKGHYRIVKEVKTNLYIAAEFDI
mgnify:FL=1